MDQDDRAGWELCKSLMFKTREKRSSATGARFSRFIQGRNPVVRILDSLVGSTPEESDQEDGGLLAWLVFRVARSGTNREGGFTEAQLSNFREEGTVEKEEDASRYLGMVATETLAKYGVNKMDRKMDDEPAGASADEDDEAEAEAPTKLAPEPAPKAAIPPPAAGGTEGKPMPKLPFNNTLLYDLD